MKTIKDIKEAFQNGDLSKAGFISRIHDVHERLFEYAEAMKGTDIAKIEIEDGLVTMTTREAGIKLMCDQHDERIIPLEIFNFGEFEGDELRAIKKIIKHGWQVFDVGANIGWYSINFSKSFPDASIAAFEPVPSTYRYLLANLSLNQVKNVQAHDLGFSNESGSKDMFIYREGMGNASLTDLSERDGVEKVTARFRTMDEFTAEQGLRPDFIKCDVEGAELFVFQGAIETLKRDRPVVFTEMLRKWSAKFGYHPNDIIDLFAGLGYACYTIEAESLKKFGRVNEDTTATNYLFVHEIRLSDIELPIS